MSLIIPSNTIRRKRQNLSYKPTAEMEEAASFQYGKFNFDYAINYDGLKISFEEKMGLVKYKRALKDWTKELNISSTNSNIIICPVEPLNLPDNVTDFLEIGFSEIKIQPESKCVVFLTFPLEIGIFIETEDHNTDVLDVVSYVYPKYSLYGQASRGVITRWHKSEVYFQIPQVKNNEFGVLRLEIDNQSKEWVEVGRVVIYEKGLNLYYDNYCVSACASMVVANENIATVTGVDTALNSEMIPSMKTFTYRKMYDFYNVNEMLTDTIFTMDMGLL